MTGHTRRVESRSVEPIFGITIVLEGERGKREGKKRGKGKGREM